MKISLFFSLLVVSCAGFATTWIEKTVDDPILEGEKCTVNEPGSSGSYIFHWPSKYDQVFWPYTDIHSIWFCEKSGYVSFMTDFNELKPAEKKNIQAYLKGFQLKKPTEKELLQTLEEIYEMRELDSEYRNMLSRVFARWHQKLGDINLAARYRKEALTEIETALLNELAADKKLEYLYLAANYTRFFNQLEKSNKYLEELNKQILATTEPKLKGYADYIGKLAEQTQYIVPGRSIEPELPEAYTKSDGKN